MHRSLRIPEIVSLICDKTLNGAEHYFRSLNSDTSQTLAALARTCKAFQDPALDVLWRYQSTVMHVLDCMPGDIWELDDPESEEVRLKRPVLPSDWERPLAYSRRVKSFKYDAAHSYPDSAAFYEMLRMCLLPEPLFPNIESIEWDTSDAALFPHFCLFLGPRLTSLTLGLCQSTPHLSLLPTLAMQCPLLEEVSIACSKGLVGRCESVSFFVKELTHLKNLEVPCLDAAALEHIARLPNFDPLYLSDQTPVGPFLTPSPSEVPSSALEELSMTLTDVSAATEVLAQFRHCLLRRVAVTVPRNTPANAIAKCYTAVELNCHRKSLSSLSIEPEESAQDTADQAQIALYAIRGAHLLPLFMFRKLESVTIAGPVGLDLDDVAAADMARAWPRIMRLQLCASSFKHISPRMTLRALLAFAQFCPRLWMLELSLDATAVAEWEAGNPEEERRQQRHLTSLHVVDSPIGLPLIVAAFLSSVFPKLECITTERVFRPIGRPPPPETPETVALHGKWKAVEAALPVLRTVRAEERCWMHRELEKDSD
ncbi:hypothetical protein B0H14DRAFT_2887402 [Mycena olivaceomarginata]|nr:hypothetical protein B0H14DRAFT_2887402 [Mycena olivaceomarginata]